MVYDDVIEDKIDAIIEQFRSSEPEMKNMRWHAIKVLEQDETVLKRHPGRYKGDRGPELREGYH